MYIICTFLNIIVQKMYNVNSLNGEFLIMILIGKKLKELRNAEGLTQEKLAKILKISRVNYTRYETDASRPDYETLVEIADFYDISLDELLQRNNYKL